MRQNVHAENFTEGVTPITPLVAKFNLVAGNSKAFIVPNNEQWKICSLMALLTSIATVGNRQVAVSIYDSTGNMVIRSSAGAVQAAGLVRRYSFIQGATRETAFVATDELLCALPSDARLGPGWQVYVADTANIEAGDTLAVSMTVEKVLL